MKTLLSERIERSGPLTFHDFMAAALYDPRLGYYSGEIRPIGRNGDFFTSVSVGSLFGELLARRFFREWTEIGSPARWRIVECGGHDGSLARDVLDALERLDSRAIVTLEYVIVDPLLEHQDTPPLTLPAFPHPVRFTRSLIEFASDPLPGIAFGNEVLDALPCHLVEWQAGTWVERRVALNPMGGLAFETCAIGDALLLQALIPLGGHFPDGYRTEVRTCYQSFLEPLVLCLKSGLMIWADYGFNRQDYYHPDRTAGTLRTYAKHRAGENPLDHPGETDITAHVDFTAVAEAAQALGGRPTAFCDQGTWLTATARDALLAQEGHPPSSHWRQFHTLTHPAHLGRCFHILELSWNPAAPTQNLRPLTL